jgi:hypothetical protein
VGESLPHAFTELKLTYPLTGRNAIYYLDINTIPQDLQIIRKSNLEITKADNLFLDYCNMNFTSKGTYPDQVGQMAQTITGDGGRKTGGEQGPRDGDAVNSIFYNFRMETN